MSVLNPTVISGLDASKATASAADILIGKTAGVGDELIEGTMPNRGAVSQALNAGGSYTIPKGYHNGSGKVTANTLASQTSGTATASQILSGKTAWVGGTKITGNIASLGAKTYTPTTSNQTIASGKYLSGTQTIKGDSNLVASNIVEGKTIFGVTGTGYKAFSLTARPEHVLYGYTFTYDGKNTYTGTKIEETEIISDLSYAGKTNYDLKDMTMTSSVKKINDIATINLDKKYNEQGQYKKLNIVSIGNTNATSGSFMYFSAGGVSSYAYLNFYSDNTLLQTITVGYRNGGNWSSDYIPPKSYDLTAKSFNKITLSIGYKAYSSYYEDSGIGSLSAYSSGFKATIS